MLRALLVDDEPLAIRRMGQLLTRVEHLEVVGSATSCGEAIEAVTTLRPDLVFLDISLRDGTGFDVIDALEAPLPMIVFVTAYDRFAVQAFETCAVDFLLKPVTSTRLKAAVERVTRVCEDRQTEARIDELRQLVESLRRQLSSGKSEPSCSHVWIRGNSGGMVRIAASDVSWVESEEDYVRVHTDKASYLMRGSIRTFLDQIDDPSFMRVHRRALVRQASIGAIERVGPGRYHVVLEDGTVVPAGRIYAKNLASLREQAK